MHHGDDLVEHWTREASFGPHCTNHSAKSMCIFTASWQPIIVWRFRRQHPLDVNICNTLGSVYNGGICNTLGSVCAAGICNTLGNVCNAGICNNLDSVYSKLFSSYILCRSEQLQTEKSNLTVVDRWPPTPRSWCGGQMATYSPILVWWTDGHLLPHLGVVDRWPPTPPSLCGGQMATYSPILVWWTDGHLLPHLGVVDRWPPTPPSWYGGQMVGYS